jgi:putative tryptophan/tyrosine transport system substrate-binding protein
MTEPVMRRREFITLLGGAAATWPLTARAQQPALPVIGFLNGQSPAELGDQLAALRTGLNASGLFEHRNVGLEYRWAEGRYERLPAYAADLIRLQVSVIIAGGGTASALAAKAATKSIPVLFVVGSDPVKVGLVDSLNRPEGNITGVSFYVNALHAKRLGLVRELLPNGRSIGFLVNPTNPSATTDISDAQEAARALGFELHLSRATSESAIAQAFATFEQMHVDAVFVEADAFYVARREQFAALSLRHRLPSIHSQPFEAAAGGLMSYGVSPINAYRDVGHYAARILKGEKPADLPVMLPTKFELVINLKTAKALRIEVPDRLLALADAVME